MTKPSIILASASPRRRDLLGEIVTGFHVVASHASELDDAGLAPRRLCEMNAERKAWLVAERYPEHLILGADTLVFLDGRPLGKPADLPDARRMLASLSGRIHEVITGVCLVQRNAGRMRLFSEVTRVRFRALSPEAIEDYVGRVDVLDKAGAYAIQEEGHRIVEFIEGSFSNVVGLPVEPVREAIAGWGRPEASAVPSRSRGAGTGGELRE